MEMRCVRVFGSMTTSPLAATTRLWSASGTDVPSSWSIQTSKSSRRRSARVPRRPGSTPRARESLAQVANTTFSSWLVFGARRIASWQVHCATSADPASAFWIGSPTFCHLPPCALPLTAKPSGWTKSAFVNERFSSLTLTANAVPALISDAVSGLRTRFSRGMLVVTYRSGDLIVSVPLARSSGSPAAAPTTRAPAA